ncbi:adenylate kinase isoenzyme 5 [Sabethes cyaneus]|uniref:adenylate kinase isoenzyme 5 n=1 Tax=Sabethes cyaneus TaxID=53552 RepID=UPI00237E12EC|nr:adenylate kinase isoenzyme 5 [Sabethes cyaneus]
MGICLDTDKSNTVQEVEETDWKGGGRGGDSRVAIVASPTHSGVGGNRRGAAMQNVGKVKFDPPKVPVIFILGGPGSGKVTHCDTLMQERRGVTHINMMDLLQQYAIGNDMQDFSKLSSRTVTEVLMLEMKMSPAAKTYLVSGYPRSMRDVVEYSEKIQVINGVILISWRQTILQRQIDYGAKLGHVVLSLAKMELENFFKNVMPVADYFDQSDMLIAINGERAPSEVYKDFRAAVLDILGAQENQEALLNGVAGMGRGVDDIPGSIVSVETAPSQHKVITAAPAHQVEINSRTRSPSPTVRSILASPGAPLVRQQSRIDLGTESVPQQNSTNMLSVPDKSGKIPPIIWVIGGPGSNKATLCLKAVGVSPGWGHFSVGRLLRTMADSDPRIGTNNYAVKEAITAGEMVPKNALEQLLATQLNQLKDKRGIIIDGFPRDMEQVAYFEKEYNQKPPIILLDCSKLQLGRGRLDDTVSSFRRRLELFRELTLPMLKEMDTAGRLTIVDGDTDSPTVQREFERIVRENIQKVIQEKDASNADITPVKIGSFKNAIQQSRRQSGDTVVHDLDADVPGVVPTISHHVSLANGHIGAVGIPAGAKNGFIPNGRPNFRNMLQEADNFDSHM